MNLRYFIFLVLMSGFTLLSHSQENLTYNDTSYFIPYDNDFNLIMSASRGHLSNVESLLKRDADINAVTVDGVTALMYAADNGDLEMIRFLMENGADPDIQPFNGVTALMSAARQNHFAVAEYLTLKEADLDIRDEEGITALHYAAAYNNFEIVDMLIFYGADIKIPDRKGNTPLITASYNNCYETVEILITNNASVNAKDNKGFTALMAAVQENNRNIAHYLLQNGAEINAENKGGMTPLAIAVKEGNYELSEFLIENDANIKHTIGKGRNILEIAKEENEPEIEELLIAKGATPNRTPVLNTITMGPSFIFNSDDFMISADFGISDRKYNFDIRTGFAFRPSAVRVLEKEDEFLFYQYWERRYYFYLGLEKKFKIYESRGNLQTGPLAGLDEIFTYGNYRGSGNAPDSRFITVPFAGWYLGNDSFTLKLKYERMNFDIPDFDKGRFSLGISYNLPMKKKSLIEKQIDWVSN